MKGFRAVASSVVAAGLLGMAWAPAAEAGQGTGAPGVAAAITPPAAATSSYAGFIYAGPPPPVAPDVISRDGDGRATVRAVRLSEPLKIDGALDEAHYRDVPPFSGFIQIEPRDGAPATEQTEVWISFDDDNVYMSFRCLDSEIDRLVANEMRRDNGNIFSGNDIVAFMLDTYYDRRNNVTFTMNAIGGRMDGQVTNESQYNGDFNPVWNLQTARAADAWTVEVAIPFKSLKYRPGRSQIWGFNVERVKRSKNEISFLTHVSKARGQQALRQASLAATIVGLEVPAQRAEPRPEALRDVEPDDGPQGRPSNLERSGRRRRPRREVRRHAEHDRRPDRQYRFRAGRGRRAADQSDALQPLLSRKTRLLPREPGDVRLRRRRGDRRGLERCSDPVLQPPHRVQQEPGGAAPGRRTADRTRRQIHRRRPEHADRRRGEVELEGHELFRVPAEARYSAPKQRRRHFHRPLGRSELARVRTRRTAPTAPSRSSRT